MPFDNLYIVYILQSQTRENTQQYIKFFASFLNRISFRRQREPDVYKLIHFSRIWDSFKSAVIYLQSVSLFTVHQNKNTIRIDISRPRHLCPQTMGKCGLFGLFWFIVFLSKHRCLFKCRYLSKSK